MTPKEMHIIVTVDVEEDDWTGYHRSIYSTENLREMPLLQRYFDDAEIMPTYLINYPVATDPFAVGFLKEISKDGRCEIGTHIHPWNTPPFEEPINDRNKMFCNLPEDLQYRKLRHLHETIRDNVKVSPVSFRAGRWAFDPVVARTIHRLEYKVDTSITPYTDWSDIVGPDYSDVPPDLHLYPVVDSHGNPNGTLLEVPASIGYLQKNNSYCNNIYKMFKKKYFEKIKVLGFLNRLNILNKIWLSPELCDIHHMIGLVERFRRDGQKIINMTLHSNSMKQGMNPFIKGKAELEKFKDNLQNFMKHVKRQGIRSMRLADALSLEEPPVSS